MIRAESDSNGHKIVFLPVDGIENAERRWKCRKKLN
jgi:hypothetical protein